MFDCSAEIKNFHKDRVTIPTSVQDTLRGHRKANQDRLQANLKAAEKPTPEKFVKQGSYAMRTMIVQDKDYDIDDGAVFDLDKLGSDTSCSDAKSMVCSSLKSDTFKRQPEVRENCVRVFYAGYYHVDIPVYRTTESGDGYELASKEWKKSDPEGVTKWFKDRLKSQSDGGKQMRRLTRLLKKFSKSRSSWKLPSGFEITILIDECISGVLEREDDAFRRLLICIRDRLSSTIEVTHPVVYESLTVGREKRFEDLRDKLSWAISELAVLDEENCTRLKALKAWRKVFDTDYFDPDIKEESEKSLRDLLS